MKPAKPGRERIRKPRDKGGGGREKPSNSTEFDLPRAVFALSVHDPAKLPPPGAAEIAFVGRSNAGKSSAINALAKRRRLAFVSKTPGRTQLINFFSAGPRAFLVDLPGYGYAGVPAAVQKHWEGLVGTYVAARSSLALMVIVMDARRPLTVLDRRLIEWLRDAGRGAHVLLTKSDKLSKQAATATLTQVRANLATLYPGATAQLFSSLRHEGVDVASERLRKAVRDYSGPENKSPA